MMSQLTTTTNDFANLMNCNREMSPKRLSPLKEDLTGERSNLSSPTPSMLRFESQRSSQSFKMNSFNVEAEAHSLQATPIGNDEVDASFFNANLLENKFSSATSQKYVNNSDAFQTRINSFNETPRGKSFERQADGDKK